MSGPVSCRIDDQILAAAARMTDWAARPARVAIASVNAGGSVSAHFGPTILSEHDCVLHYARFLNQVGVAWEDMHLELSSP